MYPLLESHLESTDYETDIEDAPEGPFSTTSRNGLKTEQSDLSNAQDTSVQARRPIHKVPGFKKAGLASRPFRFPALPGYNSPLAGADPNLQQWFRIVNSDQSGLVSAAQLKRVFVNGLWTSKL